MKKSISLVRGDHAIHISVIVKVGHKPRKLVMESKPRKSFRVFSFDSRISIEPFYQYMLSTCGVPAPALGLPDLAENATDKVPVL